MYQQLYWAALLLLISSVSSSWLSSAKSVFRVSNPLRRARSAHSTSVDGITDTTISSGESYNADVIQLEREELMRKFTAACLLNKQLRRELAKLKKVHIEELVYMQQFYDKDMAQLFEQFEQYQNETRKSITLELEELYKQRSGEKLQEAALKHDAEMEKLATDLERANASTRQLTFQLNELRQELSNIITLHGKEAEETVATIKNLKQEIEKLQFRTLLQRESSSFESSDPHLLDRTIDQQGATQKDRNDIVDDKTAESVNTVPRRQRRRNVNASTSRTGSGERKLSPNGGTRSNIYGDTP